VNTILIGFGAAEALLLLGCVAYCIPQAIEFGVGAVLFPTREFWTGTAVLWEALLVTIVVHDHVRLW
jgi:hypothetical protein